MPQASTPGTPAPGVPSPPVIIFFVTALLVHTQADGSPEPLTLNPKHSLKLGPFWGLLLQGGGLKFGALPCKKGDHHFEKWAFSKIGVPLIYPSISLVEPQKSTPLSDYSPYFLVGNQGIAALNIPFKIPSFPAKNQPDPKPLNPEP